MSRIDWKKGRWPATREVELVYEAMRGWRDVSGDWLDYYRFNPNSTQIDPIYDEATGQGRVYYPPVRVPSLHVVLIRGENENTDTGFYYNDTLSATIAFDQFVETGMDYADLLTGNFLKDRIYYNQKIFRVVQIQPEGKIQQRPTIVQIDATQLRPDELIDDQEFAQWSQPANLSLTP